jgi:hypothetical protein
MIDWRRVTGHVLRCSVGPLALAGFLLPWGHGDGTLAAVEFTGFSLVRFTGHVQAAGIDGTTTGAAFAGRILTMAVAVAAAWQTVLAPWARWHFAYRWSGWYLVFAAAALAVTGLVRSGFVMPPPGLACVVAGGAAYLLGRDSARRPHTAGGAPASHAAPDDSPVPRP